MTINILGTNDAAVLSADTEPDRDQRGGRISTSGTLTISDVDSPATFVAQAGTAGSYGTFAIDAAGAWTYTASTAHNEFVGRHHLHRHLHGRQRRRHATSVTINILGTNDAAVLSADTANLTETNSAADISTTGTLTISDVDSPATFVAQAGTAGSYGTFAIDAAGAWTYTASSAHNEFVAGTTYTDTFTVASADGTPTSVTINILGTNDAAASHDFSGNGKADILWQNTDGTAACGHERHQRLRRRERRPSIPVRPGTPIGPATSTATARPTSCGRTTTARPAMWLMNGTNVRVGGDVGRSIRDRPGTSIGAGDFNGDGKADILWQNARRHAGVWLMDGTERHSAAPCRRSIRGRPGT